MCGLVKGGIIGCVVALLVVLLFDVKSSCIGFLMGVSFSYIGTILGNEYL